MILLQVWWLQPRGSSKPPSALGSVPCRASPRALPHTTPGDRPAELAAHLSYNTSVSARVWKPPGLQPPLSEARPDPALAWLLVAGNSHIVLEILAGSLPCGILVPVHHDLLSRVLAFHVQSLHMVSEEHAVVEILLNYVLG